METVAVVGALGAQGGSVINALSSSPITSHWKIRALTSSPESEPALAFGQQANVTVVHCDVNAPETIRRAFEGCTHIFANTAFHGSTALSKGQGAAELLEQQQGLNLMRAAAETKTLNHLIWSTLNDSSVISNGQWPVPHFMSKQAANAYAVGGYPGCEMPWTSSLQKEPGWGVLRDRTTLMAIGLYGSNFRNHAYRPIKDPDGEGYIVQLPCSPDTPFPIAGDESHNVGILVRALFEHPKISSGAWVTCESERISCRQWVSILNAAARSQGVSRPVTFRECTMQSMEDRWGILGNEIGQMMAYIGDTKDRAFENTTGLREITAKEVGVGEQLVSTQGLYEKTDCAALFKEVDAGEMHLGTASR